MTANGKQPNSEDAAGDSSSRREPELQEGRDYYIEDGLFVMTAAYHKKRGSCCGSRCRWCPFEPKYELGATKLASDPALPAHGENES